MSVTGPGCEHCNGLGVVDWQDQPFTDRAPPFSHKPCDHCGGFSQFPTAVELNRMQDRAATADAICKDLAAFYPYTDIGGCRFAGCYGIEDRVQGMGRDHSPECPWLRARQYAEGN